MSNKIPEAAILPQKPAPLKSTTALLQTTGHKTAATSEFGASFPVKVPTGFSDLIEYGDLLDPLLRQVLPSPEEDLIHPNFSTDPTDDLSQQPIPGLLHKYHGRALLITTGACAIHCRYCFRRHYPYQSKQIKPSHWQQILQYLANDNSIHEIILSGGDPFTLSDTKLLPFLDDLEAIPHLQTIRFHTRLLSFTPERLTTAFTNWLKDTSTSVVIVYHINHAQELSEPLHHTTKKLQQLSVTQLNQSVLLKGINDDADTLAQLNQQLFQYRILPYYLHQLDLVQGAAHFKVSDTEAKLIHHTLQQRLPGYLVPKLVYEAPHTGSKQWL